MDNPVGKVGGEMLKELVLEQARRYLKGRWLKMLGDERRRKSGTEMHLDNVKRIFLK